MTLYGFDTGPLLCFAACKGGPALLAGRYQGKAVMVADVDAELRGLSRHANPKVAKAAQTACTAYRWIERVTVTDPALLLEIDTVRDLIDTFKPARTTARRPREDWGEAATIVYARRHSVEVVVINEDAATRAASARGVAAVRTTDVLRAMVRDGTLTANQAYQHYRSMIWDLDPGEVIASANDLR